MKISDGELNLLELIWDNEPVKSGELVTLALKELGWKKSTVYTVIKKLTLKNAVKSENSVVTALVSREAVAVQRAEGVKEAAGSLPMFIAAFLRKEKLTKEQAEELKRLIDSYTEE